MILNIFHATFKIYVYISFARVQFCSDQKLFVCSLYIVKQENNRGETTTHPHKPSFCLGSWRLVMSDQVEDFWLWYVAEQGLSKHIMHQLQMKQAENIEHRCKNRHQSRKRITDHQYRELCFAMLLILLSWTSEHQMENWTSGSNRL